MTNRPHLSVVKVLQPHLYEDLPPVEAHFQSRARREGHEYDAIAMARLEQTGAKVHRGRSKLGHYAIDGIVDSSNGGRYIVMAHGNLSDASRQPGLRRTDTLSKVAHRATMLHRRNAPPLVVVTSHLPLPCSEAAHQLSDLHLALGPWLVDVVATSDDDEGFDRLRWFFTATPRPDRPRSAPWWNPDHERTLLDDLPGSAA